MKDEFRRHELLKAGIVGEDIYSGPSLYDALEICVDHTLVKMHLFLSERVCWPAVQPKVSFFGGKRGPCLTTKPWISLPLLDSARGGGSFHLFFVDLNHHLYFGMS